MADEEKENPPVEQPRVNEEESAPTEEARAEGPKGKLSKIKCGCGIDLELVCPQPEIVNVGSMSALVFAHPELQICPQCGQPYLFLLTGVPHYQTAWKPIPVNPSRLMTATPRDVAALEAMKRRH